MSHMTSGLYCMSAEEHTAELTQVYVHLTASDRLHRNKHIFKNILPVYIYVFLGGGLSCRRREGERFEYTLIFRDL